MYDAVILSGGRGSRLGGISKASLLTAGRPLLVETVLAAAGARRRVVVGEGAPGLPADVLVTREDPPFSGPAAALGAGVAALQGINGPPPELILVLACDMPRVNAVVTLLLDAVDGATDGVVAVDGAGRAQYLAAVYRQPSLSRALARGPLVGASMRSLLTDLRLAEVFAPEGATDDVDTWEDARRLQVTESSPSSEEMRR